MFTILLKVVVLHDGGDDVALNGGIVAVGVHAEEYLHLELQQFATSLFVVAEVGHHCLELFEKRMVAYSQREGKSNECTLFQIFVGGLMINLFQDLQLIDIKLIHCREHDGANHHSCVNRVDSGRENQLAHRRSLPFVPLG